MRYRCAHCLKPLAFVAEGVLEQCPDHPDGGVEVTEPEQEEPEPDAVPND